MSMGNCPRCSVCAQADGRALEFEVRDGQGRWLPVCWECEPGLRLGLEVLGVHGCLRRRQA